MSAECIQDFVSLAVQDHLLVDTRADREAAVGKVDPSAEVVPNAAGLV